MPIDMPALTQEFGSNWECIQEQLIARIDKDYGVYDGRTFKSDRWERWLARTFDSVATTSRVGIWLWTTIHFGRWHARILPLGQFANCERRFLKCGSMNWQLARMAAIVACCQRSAVGQVETNPAIPSSFSVRRCGFVVWFALNQGWRVAYLDYEQQEFGIGAALSGDKQMMRAYETGDPYLSFAKQAGAVPRRCYERVAHQ